MSEPLYPTGAWLPHTDVPTRLHMFVDASRDKTLCGTRRLDQPLIRNHRGLCKICAHLAEAYKND
jgi:hypothetical protein